MARAPTDPGIVDPADGYIPLSREDVAEDNPAFLAHSFRMLRTEIRGGFESIVETFGKKILPSLERIEMRLDDAVLRVNQLERSFLSLKDRVAALERGPFRLPTARTVTRRKPAARKPK